MVPQRISRSSTSSRVAPGYPLSRLAAALAAILLLGILTLIAASLMGLHLGIRLLRPNLFANYEAIWPGQPVSSVAAFAVQRPRGYISCLAGSSPGYKYAGLDLHIEPGIQDAHDEMICASHSTDGIFHWIAITVNDGRVQELQLYSDTLQQDTLFLYWGAPDAISQSGDGEVLILHWDRSAYSVMASVTKYSWVATLVTLTAAGTKSPEANGD
jgi:hypothetical protein